MNESTGWRERHFRYENMRNLGMNLSNPGVLAPVMTDEQRSRHQAKLDETRPLTGKPQHYLTGLECGCKTLSINETGE